MRDRSVSLNTGPMIAFLPRLPKWNTPSADTGSAKMEDEVQEPAMRGSHFGPGEVVAVLGDDRLIAVRIVVGRFRQGVRAAELQTVRHPVVRRDPESLVVRDAEAGGFGNVAQHGPR